MGRTYVPQKDGVENNKYPSKLLHIAGINKFSFIEIFHLAKVTFILNSYVHF
jgi:hypothetical protein